jgi:phage protein D
MSILPESAPFYLGQDFYVPSFEVIVDGKEIKPQVIRDILSVTYRDSLTEIDSFEITINNWDAEKREFKYSNGPLFDPGGQIELWMGYLGQKGSKGGLKKMLTGEITSLRPSFPAQGQPTLVVSGLNLLHRLRDKQISRSYVGKTDNQILEEIKKRLKVKIEVEQQNNTLNKDYPYLFQENMYDIVFLLIRAHRIGYELFVDEEAAKALMRPVNVNQRASKGSGRPAKLVFKPSTDVSTKVFDLKYGLTLIEFSPELTTAEQVGKVTVKGWDAVRKEPISETVTRDHLKTRVVKKKNEKKLEDAIANREEVITNKPVNSKGEAKELAKQTLQRIAKDILKGSGSVVGLPELRTGCVLRLDGMGWRFGGRYFVTGTTHTIGDGGYTTRFECRLEEQKERNDEDKGG